MVTFRRMPHVHRFHAKDDSWVRRCRCGLARTGSLQWQEMTGTDFQDLQRRWRENGPNITVTEEKA